MSSTDTNKTDKQKRSLKRPIIYLVATILVCVVGIMFPPVGDSPSMKVVVDVDGFVARYISEDDEAFYASTQDSPITILKHGAEVKTYYAAKGQGIVYMYDYGTLNVYKKPNEKSKVIGSLEYEAGYVPNTYPCLGYKKGWFKVKVNDKTGYVHKDNVAWDAVDSF